MAFYTGDRFPKWKGNLFVGALADQLLVRLTLDGEQGGARGAHARAPGRIRDVRAGPDGYLYVLSESDDALLRLEPAN